MQLRLFNGDTRLNKDELEIEMERNPVLWDKTGNPLKFDPELIDRDGACSLTLDMDAPIGWCAKPHAPEVDLTVAGALSVGEFFSRVVAKDGVVTFLPNQLHIFSTAEYVRVPPHLACEMRPMDGRSGDFRAFDAGFIGPGWGYGKKGEGKGRPLTLEIRPTEPLYVRRNSRVANIGFERLFALPERHYESRAPKFRRDPGSQLARQFKPV